MNIFSRAIDDVFRQFGLSATYMPADRDPFTLTVLAKRPDEMEERGESLVNTETALFEVRKSEIEKPRPGDVLIIDDTTYLVQDEPLRDLDRLIWTLRCRPE